MTYRQHNGQTKKENRINNDLQSIQIKDRVTRTQLKTGDELRCSGRVNSSCSTSDTHCVNLVTNHVIRGKIVVCPFVLFLLSIVLFDLRFMNSDSPIWYKIKIEHIPYNIIFTTKFNDSSILITIISWDYLN
jgi:hypothetical protein